MEEKLVSIITPCYNGEDYAARFFNNILEQSYKNIELIFINDGSTDKTEEIALGFRDKFEEQKQKLVYIYQDNAGQAAAVNKGLKIFTGEYLVWTDSDDLLHKDNIKRKVEFLEQHPEYGWAQCFGREVLESNLNEKIRDFRRIPPVGKDKFFEDIIMKKNVEYTPGLYIVRRNVFLEANPKCDIYESRIGQNYQMLLPIAYKSSCGYLEEDLFSYVIRDQSHSHDHIASDEFIRRLLETKTMLLETLKRIDLGNEENYYIHKVEEKIIRDQLNAGFAFRDNGLLTKAYQELKQKKYVTKRDALVYYAYKYKFVNKIFQSLKKQKAKINNRMVNLRKGA